MKQRPKKSGKNRRRKEGVRRKGRSCQSRRKTRRNSKPLAAAMEAILIVETSSGKIEKSVNAELLCNPASNIKVACALAVLEKFGSEQREKTGLYISGEVDKQGVLHGDLYLSGSYMLFGDKQARQIAAILNARGINEIAGRIIVSADFSMNLHARGLAAGQRLAQILDPGFAVFRRPLSQEKDEDLSAVLPLLPGLKIAGPVETGEPPASASKLAEHFSPPVRDVLKVMLCYSDNTMAERFGESIGGAGGLRQFIIDFAGVGPAEIKLASTSGLGVNRLSARAMIAILQSMRLSLMRRGLTFADLLAVAGIDQGTLYKRLNARGQAGSVIAKTGTLIQTDGGASALAGEIASANGASHLFAIFHMHGDVPGFRARQDALVTAFQATQGGASPVPYVPILPRIENEDYWIQH